MWNVINDHKDFFKQKWWMEQTELLQLDQSNIIYFKMNENLRIEKKISLPRSKVFQQITFLPNSVCLSRMEESRGI